MKLTWQNHGSLVLVEPIDIEAERWLKENTNGTWYMGALVVEPRYVDALVQGFEEEGGEVS